MSQLIINCYTYVYVYVHIIYMYICYIVEMFCSSEDEHQS